MTGGSGANDDLPPTPVAGAGPVAEFSTTNTSAFQWSGVGMAWEPGVGWQSYGWPVVVASPRYLGILTDEAFYPSLVCSGRERSAE